MPDDKNLLFLYELEKLLVSRKKELPENSYTTLLFNNGIDSIAQKLGEEAVELIIASKNDDTKETVYEAADLIYHFLVLLAEKKIPLDSVIDELQRRSKK